MKRIVPRARAFVPAPRIARPEHAPNYRYSHHIPEDADFDDLRFAGDAPPPPDEIARTTLSARRHFQV
jgi:hypothetical protein